MSTDDNYGFGITDEDREKFSKILETNTKHGERRHHKHSDHVDEDQPELPIVDGEKQVAELRGGALQTRKAHRPNPESDGPYPWCVDRVGGYGRGSSSREWVYRGLGMACEWREPCSVCFPEGFDE